MKNGNNEFLYYLLMNFKSRILNFENGSVFGSINAQQIRELKFGFPEEQEQKAIAKILSDLDSKIELLQQQNKTLEEIGKALFKHWFVDFEFPYAEGKPYKSSGGDMVESELGEIPKSWDVESLSKVAQIVGGGTPSTVNSEYYTARGIAWLTPRDFSGYPYKFISKGNRDITEKGLKNSSATLIPKGTIVFSSRVPIGYIAISLNEVSTNQGFKSLVPKNRFITDYLYYYIKNNITSIENMASGSTFKEVSGTVMKNFKSLIPDKQILKLFEIFMIGFNKKLMLNQNEIIGLQKTCDLLLPKLMSGQIRVPIKVK